MLLPGAGMRYHRFQSPEEARNALQGDSRAPPAQQSTPLHLVEEPVTTDRGTVHQYQQHQNQKQQSHQHQQQQQQQQHQHEAQPLVQIETPPPPVHHNHNYHRRDEQDEDKGTRPDMLSPYRDLQKQQQSRTVRFADNDDNDGEEDTDENEEGGNDDVEQEEPASAPMTPAKRRIVTSVIQFVITTAIVFIILALFNPPFVQRVTENENGQVDLVYGQSAPTDLGKAFVYAAVGGGAAVALPYLWNFVRGTSSSNVDRDDEFKSRHRHRRRKHRHHR